MSHSLALDKHDKVPKSSPCYGNSMEFLYEFVHGNELRISSPLHPRRFAPHSNVDHVPNARFCIFPVFSRYDLNMPILKIFPDIPIPIPVSASQVFSLLEMMFGQLNPEDLPSVPRSSELLMKSLRERSLERAQEGGG